MECDFTMTMMTMIMTMMVTMMMLPIVLTLVGIITDVMPGHNSKAALPIDKY